MGTFEFTSGRIVADGYQHAAKIRMRTGGSTGSVPRSSAQKLEDGSGYYWNVTGGEEGHEQSSVRLPVKYRYRSPVVFEFHVSGKRKADAYAVVWLQHFIDNDDTPINIPIWQTASPARITQNYITEDNYKNEPALDDLKEIGRLQFRAKFNPGMDESHETFISDNDSRETFETWEACHAEGVRQRTVEKEVADRVQTLHDESLTEGRDVLKNADEDEKQKWLSKSGTDWSGAFGEDPKAYVDASGRKRREPGRDKPLKKGHNDNGDEKENEDDEDLFEEGDDSDDDSSSLDLGIKDATSATSPTSPRSASGTAASGASDNKSDSATGSPLQKEDTKRSLTSRISGLTGGSKEQSNKQNKRTEQRKQRGLMQWRPARNVKFAKDEGKIGIRKLKGKITGGLDGRQPGVETETGS